MKIRITYYGEAGTIYSEVEEEGTEDVFGEWTAPFPNEEGNSTAFGLAECILQSGYNLFREEKIERIKVENYA